TCKALYALAQRAPRDLGEMEVVRNRPLIAHVAIHAKPARGRKHRNRRGLPARDSKSRKHARRESEPWLLMASPGLHLNARQLAALYARRMQIELSFRDLKSHRYGQAFEDSLTRKGSRIEILLLINALAAFAAWLVGIACEASGIDQWLAPYRSKRRLYSVMRLGREALVRRWLTIPLGQLVTHLRKPTPQLLDQLSAPA
ncbi:MAG: transposase, partial [Rhodanobacteraceae bacterium]